MIRPESLNRCMKKWVLSIAVQLAEKIETEEEEQDKKKKKKLTVAIDGKEKCSTGKMKKYDSPMHIVSAQIGELGLTLAQRTVASKSNEIPAVQELIKELEIAGCMVVADALNCQIQTAQPERKGGMDAKRDAVRIRQMMFYGSPEEESGRLLNASGRYIPDLRGVKA